MQKRTIFLGGSREPSLWRKVLINDLKALSIDYYNPEGTEWSESLEKRELELKENADILIFGIDKFSHSIETIIDAVEYIARGKKVLLFVEVLEKNAKIHGRNISEEERREFNATRNYLRKMAERNLCIAASSVEELMSLFPLYL